jgi:RNA polymerase sigma-70 factor (ECF subfamily)
MQEFDPNWLSQALAGNSQGFSEIVDAFQKPVYNLCYRMLGNAEDAEDAAQETFLRVYKNLKKFDPSRSFSTWILSIAAHYCIDQIRKRKFHLISVEDLKIPEIPDKKPGMETNLVQKEKDESIRKLLGELKPVDKAIVVLYYWYDFSYEEICQSLGVTNSAVKSRLHRARKAMAAIWSENQNQIVMTERMAL